MKKTSSLSCALYLCAPLFVLVCQAVPIRLTE